MLKVGCEYIGEEKAQSFVFDGGVVNFPSKRLHFRVLKKPKTVIADDGVVRIEEPLPKHLQEPVWYAIFNLSSKKSQWLHSEGWAFTLVG